MRLPRVVWGVVCALSPIAAVAEESFPHTGYTNADRVLIRSGPGERFYPTTQLGRGAKLTIYRQDPGGWYAVRPPEGSFSWVQGAYLMSTDEIGIARITSDRVAAHVGTDLSDAHDVVHVHLKRDELVEVLAAERRATEVDASATGWHKIAPPAGEFRWVHRRYVERQPPESAGKAGGGPRWTSKKVPAAHGAVATGDENLPAGSSADPPPAAPITGASSLGPDLGNIELGDIELELSLIVAREPAGWQLGTLRSRAESLAGSGETVADREAARTLLDTIGEFENLKLSYEQLAPTGTLANRKGVSPITGALGTQSPAIDPRFDGTGWLMPVRSRRPDVPRYALTDDNGDILQFVMPAPGVNLQRYLRKQIGIYGQRGVMPQFRKPQVTVQRVVVLDRLRR